jgi:hypothetical protein
MDLGPNTFAYCLLHRRFPDTYGLLAATLPAVIPIGQDSIFCISASHNVAARGSIGVDQCREVGLHKDWELIMQQRETVKAGTAGCGASLHVMRSIS